MPCTKENRWIHRGITVRKMYPCHDAVMVCHHGDRGLSRVLHVMDILGLFSSTNFIRLKNSLYIHSNRSNSLILQFTCFKSHNAPHWNRNVYISVPKWCIVGYGIGALWDLWVWYIVVNWGLFQYSIRRLIVRPRKVLMPRNLHLNRSVRLHRNWTWVRQTSKRYDS